MLFITDRLPNFSGAGSVSITPADPKLVLEALQSGFISLISDTTVCNVVSGLLGAKVETKVITTSPKLGEDTVIMVNIIGPELPVGAKALTTEHSIQFSIIETKKPAINMKEIKKGIASWLLK